MYGYLQKKKHRTMLGRWGFQKRFFKLVNYTLHFYSKAKDGVPPANTKPKGSFDLRKTISIEANAIQVSCIM